MVYIDSKISKKFYDNENKSVRISLEQELKLENGYVLVHLLIDHDEYTEYLDFTKIEDIITLKKLLDAACEYLNIKE